MSMQYALELVGTYFFALSGSLAVRDVEHDWFGASFTGFITAIGGGTLRDVMLGSYPLVWIADTGFLYAVFAGILTTMFFFRYLVSLRRTLSLFDTLGISVFTVVGVEKALNLGVVPEVAVIMGIFSAVMGGVIRDTLTNTTPIIFRREVYASACMIGAIIFLGLRHLPVSRDLMLVLSASSIALTRLLAVRYKLYLPQLGKRD